MGDLLLFLGLAAVVGIAGVGLGILFLAPRLARLGDRNDEETGGGDD